MGELLRTLRRFEGRWALAEPLALDPLGAVAKEVSATLGAVVPQAPSPYDLRQTHRLLNELARKRAPGAVSAGLAELHPRELKRAPWVIFDTFDEQPPLASRKRFLEAYLAECRRRASAAIVLALAIGFLAFYPADKPYFEPVRKALRVLIRKVSSPRGERFKARSATYRLLADTGPSYFGRLMLETSDLEALLEDAGLGGMLAERGFVVAAARHSLDHLAARLEKGKMQSADLSTVLTWLGTSREADPPLRFPSLRIETAESLLLPFQERDPAAEDLQQIKRFLLDVYGDPRVEHGPWHGVAQAAEAILVRWLVRATLEDFFRLVSKVARTDKDADRMWKYRRKFWTAYLDRGVIEEAWVVLGEKMASAAKRHLDETALNAYGRLDSQGVQPHHAVLILRIGGLVITEWSHSGKYRVWDESDPASPKFNRRRYSREDLVEHPAHEGRHYGAEGGHWQVKLNRYIHEHTGILMVSSEYMP